MSTDITEKLREILTKTRETIPDNEFCGIGVVLYSEFRHLPVLSLCPNEKHVKENTLVEQLVSVSLSSNQCHDGFHLISLDWELTHVNQYFAPPLPDLSKKTILGNESRGARYISARIGSLLSDIYCTGVLSDRDGLVIFKNGEEVK